MKIRTSFVSNSSTTSFFAVGVKAEDLKKEYEDDDELEEMGYYNLASRDDDYENVIVKNIFSITSDGGMDISELDTLPDFDKIIEKMCKDFHITRDKLKFYSGMYAS